MTDYDLIVLIPWIISGAVLTLICIRLHRSRNRSVHRPARQAEQEQTSSMQEQTSSMKAAHEPKATSPGPGPPPDCQEGRAA
jgi:hypothetical protein